jgi:hypothetical protein
MKYDTPELTALVPAFNAIHSPNPLGKPEQSSEDNLTFDIHVTAYDDWE